MAQVLIVEDEILLAKSLSRSIASRGHDCVVANSAEEGLKLLERTPTDIVLLDLQLPGMSGLEAIKEIRRFDVNISVIIATAHATMATAVEAMRSGACDLLRKPLDTEEVMLALERAVNDARMRQTISYYQDVEAEKTESDRLVCRAPRMLAVQKLIDKLLAVELESPGDYPPTLILGETGTGKDLVARVLHYRGRFHNQPFIEVNCSTLPAGLEEAELFGYEKGSFTGADRSKRGLFEAAHGGTIFLNEIGDLTPEAQVKLLSVIENKSVRRVGGLRDIAVDVRILAATNRDLTNASGFREDLYYRLNNVKIELPPLRERKEDILEIARIFLANFGRKYGTRKTLSAEAEAALVAYAWPGNVRELRQLLERVSFLDTSAVVTVPDLNLPAPAKPLPPQPLTDIWQFEFPESGVNLELLEKAVIVKALKACAGNVSDAARKLGLGREALRYRINKYEIHLKTDIVG
jgi:DNA-binding NtrC family response regulator